MGCPLLESAHSDLRNLFALLNKPATIRLNKPSAQPETLGKVFDKLAHFAEFPESYTDEPDRMGHDALNATEYAIVSRNWELVGSVENAVSILLSLYNAMRSAVFVESDVLRQTGMSAKEIEEQMSGRAYGIGGYLSERVEVVAEMLAGAVPGKNKDVMGSLGSQDLLGTSSTSKRKASEVASELAEAGDKAPQRNSLDVVTEGNDEGGSGGEGSRTTGSKKKRIKLAKPARKLTLSFSSTCGGLTDALFVLSPNYG
ncbi:hypothetical protein JCM5353_004504 [Sporobolomyces roseus]